MDSGYISSRAVVALRFSDERERERERAYGARVRWLPVERIAMALFSRPVTLSLPDISGYVRARSANFCDVPESEARSSARRSITVQ